MTQSFVDVQNLVLGDDFEPTKYRARARQAVNDALALIARNATVPALEATWTVPIVAGTGVYDLPTDLVRVRSVYDSDRRVTLDEVDAEFFDNTPMESGVPSVFTQYSGHIQFWPTPNYAAVLKARYMKTAAVLDDDSDTVTAIPDEYVYMLVAFGRSRLAAAEDDVELASFWRQEFDRDLARLRSDMGRRSLRRTRQVPGMWAAQSPPRFRRP